MTTFTPALMQDGMPVTTSPDAVFVEISHWTKRPTTPEGESLGAINSRLDANWNEVERLAELNTLRLTGKPRL